ncbi:YtpI family protein [Brevibacillus massiliensis]|jgi:hypothetical protein|uniref:YtpI family protein n=1 Tax=Brevibacillus massiliensis TaxID=1118054 RepID=UPI00030742A4|nr:YtpI family protein [Brevibacillus massiliensis]
MWLAIYYTGVLASLIASVYFSINARRSGIHPLESRFTLGKMNAAMGCLLLLLGINQFTFETITTVRAVVGIVFILVGGVNLVLGLRNYVSYRREWRNLAKKNS